MIPNSKRLALVLLPVLLSACDVGFKADSRSGSLDDDYVAEPLGRMAEKYENALEISNRFVEHLKAESLDSIYTELFSAELRQIVSRQKFQDLMDKVKAEKGPVIRYKKMQWGFISGSENGRDFIGSTKIVEHEKGMMKYLIVFDDDGKFDRIVGFRLKERDGVSPPGKF